jgi:hypothetical protein
MPKDWHSIRPAVHRYYVEDRMSLTRVQEKLATEYDFNAS